MFSHTHTQTLSFSYDTAGTESTLISLQTALEGQSGPPSPEIISAMRLRAFNQGLGTVFTQIQNQASFVDFGDLSPVFSSLDVFEIARFVLSIRLAAASILPAVCT